MKKNINVVSVVLFLIALASLVAAAKGHGGASTYGFFSGG
jgi:hypothetical protein